jgi:hypothetical protein
MISNLQTPKIDPKKLKKRVAENHAPPSTLLSSVLENS